MLTTRHRQALAAAVMGVIAPCLLAETSEADLNRLIRPYSTQRIVGLDVDERFTFKLNNGDERSIRVVSVTEHRDSVINLMRRADVRVEIDGRPLELACMPYVMPAETAGLRILADTTSGWGNIEKRVQLSLWDAKNPIVDTRRFGFPLRDFRMFSHGTQCYNEPVHLGLTDGDPAGNRFYHDYGFDNAGYEGRDAVVSAVDGKVVKFWPSREDLCSILVRDRNGAVWEHGHLSAAQPDIALGTQVARDQRIGTLGKTGPSGNFSHLHLGVFFASTDAAAEPGAPETACRRLNLYPWLVAAYQSQHPKGLLAVARPHVTVTTGEQAVLDGSNSLAWGGGKIVAWRWVLPDGRTVKEAGTRKAFDKPGAYVATLWVKDDQGNEDVDFCQVKVYTKSEPEKAMPHIFMTCSPAHDVRPDEVVTFRFWFQGEGGGPMTVDFGDGTQMDGYESYAELRHGYRAPGIHIVTARCDAGGKPIEQRLKVVVKATP